MPQSRHPKIPAFLQTGRTPAARPSEPTPVDFTWMFAGSMEVLALKPSLEAVRERIARYDLQFVVTELGRMSNLLFYHGFPDQQIAQAQLLDRFFPSGTERRARIDYRIRRFRETNKKSPHLFHEVQLVNAMKLAFLDLPVETREGETSLEPLGEALLMLNALIDEPPLGPGRMDLGSEESLRAWEIHLMANGLFNSEPSLVYEFIRVHDLYFQDRPHLRGTRAYLNLPEQLKALTGLEPVALWAGLFAANVPWLNARPDQLASAVPTLRVPGFLKQEFDFGDDEVEHLLRFLATDAEVLSREVKTRYKRSLRPYDMLPFGKHPLVRFGDEFYALSVKLLQMKLYEGIHHLFLGPGTTDEQREQYLVYMGDVLDDYVQELFTRAYAGQPGRYITESDLRTVLFRQGDKVCDGILKLGDIVILAENKANSLALGIRSGEDRATYERKTKDIFLDGAEQISSVVAAIREGRLSVLGLDPSQIRVFVPLVITLEPIPPNPLLMARITDTSTAAGHLVGSDITRLQTMDVPSLHTWETGVEMGIDMGRLLREKARDSNWWSASFVNYLLAVGVPATERVGTAATHRYQTIMSQVRGYFAQRTRASSSELEQDP